MPLPHKNNHLSIFEWKPQLFNFVRRRSNHFIGFNNSFSFSAKNPSRRMTFAVKSKGVLCFYMSFRTSYSLEGFPSASTSPYQPFPLTSGWYPSTYKMLSRPSFPAKLYPIYSRYKNSTLLGGMTTLT